MDPDTFDDTMESPLITFRGRVLNKNSNFEVKSPTTGLQHNKLSAPVEDLNFDLNSIDQEQKFLQDSPRSFKVKCNSPRGKRIFGTSPFKTKSSPSPKINTITNTSRLPVKQCRFSVKELRLPPLPLENSKKFEIEASNCKVTPEKLMEELRIKVQERLKVENEAESEEVLYQYTEDADNKDNEYDSQTPSIQKPRMSLRNRCPVIVNAPDLIYEDPLEVARQTLHNTRSNSGYRQVKLIYTVERRENCRPGSPVPAFSKKKGISRHFIRSNNRYKSIMKKENVIESEDESESEKETVLNPNLNENEKKRKLKFDRVLKFFESDDDVDEEEEGLDHISSLMSSSSLKEKGSLKSCLKNKFEENNKNKLQNQNTEGITKPQTEIIQVKRICYDGEDSVPSRRIKMRRINSKGNVFISKDNDYNQSTENNRELNIFGAKRLKKSSL